MALDERTTLAMEGIVIVAVDVFRPSSVVVQATGGDTGSSRGQQLMGKIRITTRGMWVDEGRMLAQLHKVRSSTPPPPPPPPPVLRVGIMAWHVWRMTLLRLFPVSQVMSTDHPPPPPPPPSLSLLPFAGTK